MMLTGRAKLAGVMGWPVTHSRSPRLHGYWLEQHGVDGAYLPLAVAPDQIETALRALPVLGFRGVNLTLPHKERALAVCDRIEEQARRIGAVNTVVVEGEQLLGSNSDAFGFAESLKEGAPFWQAAKAPAVVIGAGGAARAVLVALLEMGVPEIRLVNRTHARAAELATTLGGACSAVDWSDRGPALAGAGLLVNTTSLGMTGQPPLELPLDRLPETAVVQDIVYVPLETPLLAAARRRGNPTVDGLGMLLHQARLGFAAWFGVAPQVTDALRAFVLDDY